MADIEMPLIEVPGLGGPVVYLEDAEAAIQAAVAAERQACADLVHSLSAQLYDSCHQAALTLRARGAAHD